MCSGCCKAWLWFHRTWLSSGLAMFPLHPCFVKAWTFPLALQTRVTNGKQQSLSPCHAHTSPFLAPVHPSIHPSDCLYGTTRKTRSESGPGQNLWDLMATSQTTRIPHQVLPVPIVTSDIVTLLRGPVVPPWDHPVVHLRLRPVRQRNPARKSKFPNPRTPIRSTAMLPDVPGISSRDRNDSVDAR